MPEPMRVLTVLSSSNQMYSGIGRAVFELAKRLPGRLLIEFAIDDLNRRNVEQVENFAARHELTVHVGRGTKRSDALDNGNDDLADLLRNGSWDAIECVCWANAATNAEVLDHVGDTTLLYTPHDQPSWTVPMGPGQPEFTEAVHRSMIRRADVVFCDSTWERREIRRRTPDRNNARFLPLGCDFRRFLPGSPDRKPQLLFVGDLAEPRKRFDRVIGVMERLRATRPDFRLVVIGNKSDEVPDTLPPSLRDAIDLRGYVDEDELRVAYAESRGLVLLSEFEAFGIPILEALACATPVFLTSLDPTMSLFETYRGAHFCPADDLDATAGIIARALDRSARSIEDVRADRRRLEAQFDWDHLAEAKWCAMSAAWYRRNCWSWTA